MDFEKPKKKKKDKKDKKDKKEKKEKKHHKKKENKEDGEEDKVSLDDTPSSSSISDKPNPFLEGDAYTYQELYQRLYDMADDSLKPEGSSKGISVKPPKIQMQPTKTAWTNYGECLKSLKRDPDHLKRYISSELGTDAYTMADDKILVLKGRY